MRSAFCCCNALTSLDLSNFDTSQVTDMYSMFYNLSSVTSLDVTNFNTSKVTNMSYMFEQCSELKEIISTNGFDLSSCSNINQMFNQCSSYSGEPLHFKNVPRTLDLSDIGGAEGVHYVIDS